MRELAAAAHALGAGDQTAPLPAVDPDEGELGTLVEAFAAMRTAVAQREERLQALSRQLLEAQEAERRRLARELHDEIGQVLTAVKLNLTQLEPHANSARALELLRDNLGIVQQAQQQVRALALELRPSLLDDLGLVPALRWYVDQQAQRAGLVAQVVTEPPEVRASAAVESACFRIVQEALTNVVRHARARQVQVVVWQEKTALELRIQDDGIGFDVATAQARARQGGSLGILGMAERAKSAGGEVEIRSRPGEGTTIRACFARAAAPTLGIERDPL